jgi:hypothetical protein
MDMKNESGKTKIDAAFFKEAGKEYVTKIACTALTNKTAARGWFLTWCLSDYL